MQRCLPPFLALAMATQMAAAATPQDPSGSIQTLPEQVIALTLASGSCRPVDVSSLPPRDTLKIESISPMAGSEMDKNTVLTAELSYTVRDYEPDQYRLLTQFQTTIAGRSTDGNFPDTAIPQLCGPAGRIVIAFPLHHVWGPGVIAHPPKVAFLIVRRIESNRSVGVADTGFVGFREAGLAIPSRPVQATTLAPGTDAASACEPIAVGTPPTTTTLTIESISPAAGSALNRDSILGITLTYAIADYQPDQDEVQTLWRTTTPGQLTSGAVPAAARPKACGSSGRMQIRLPIGEIWADPGIARPLQLVLLMVHRPESGMPRGVASTPPTAFTDWQP